MTYFLNLFGLFLAVANAFSRILKERRPSKMWVDQGGEFYNKEFKKLVELYSTENEEKSCVIEIFNRTIKEKMFKHFYANNTRTFVDVLDLLVDQYNNAIHSSIKMTPKEASREENEYIVWRNLYPELGDKIIIIILYYIIIITSICSIGDNVRITKNRTHLIKDTLKHGSSLGGHNGNKGPFGDFCSINQLANPSEVLGLY